MRLVLDHVGQGFLTVDGEGFMSEERSAVLGSWLGPGEPHMLFGDYLSLVDPRAGMAFAMGWDQARDDVLPVEMVIDQLPADMRRGDRHLQLRYTWIAQAGGPSLLVVVSDVTAEVEQRRAEEGVRDLAGLFRKVLADRAGVLEFFGEAKDLMSRIDGSAMATHDELLRALHTLKGNALLTGLSNIGRLCHELESRLAETQAAPTRGELEELTLAWQSLCAASRSLLGDEVERLEIDRDEYDELLASARSGTRASWLAQVERPQPRAIVAAAPTSGGPGLRSRGPPRKTWSDRASSPWWSAVAARTLGAVWSAFVHVVRNAVDHGIETAEERLSRGKPAGGVLVLATSVAGGELHIQLSDDGRGVQWDAVARRAQREGLPSSTHADLEAALFFPGLSTAAVISELSGRGVGLGAVREACEALGGKVSVSSVSGEGTNFDFRFALDRSRALPSRFPIAKRAS